jgi:hypothetical protein
MFDSATSFNQPIGMWNLTSATTMNNMFSGALSFHQNIKRWRVFFVYTIYTYGDDQLLEHDTWISSESHFGNIIGVHDFESHCFCLDGWSSDLNYSDGCDCSCPGGFTPATSYMEYLLLGSGCELDQCPDGSVAVNSSEICWRNTAEWKATETEPSRHCRPTIVACSCHRPWFGSIQPSISGLTGTCDFVWWEWLCVVLILFLILVLVKSELWHLSFLVASLLLRPRRLHLNERDVFYEYYFVSREQILNYTGVTLPHYQKAQETFTFHPKIFNLEAILQNQKDLRGYAAVSHRWFGELHPDPQGLKLAKIKAFLEKHVHIHYVWIDFLCMPQCLSLDGQRRARRSKDDEAYFRQALEHLYLLFLGARVLILLDKAYQSKFWTSFEFWLSLQVPSAVEGLTSSARWNRRDFVLPMLNADWHDVAALRSQWGGKSPGEAFRKLAGEDIAVTNQRDKEQQLAKLRDLPEKMMEICKEHNLIRAGVRQIWCCQHRCKQRCHDQLSKTRCCRMFNDDATLD